MSVNRHTSVLTILFAFIELSRSFVLVRVRLLDVNLALNIH